MHDYAYQRQRDGTFTVYSLKPHTGDKLDVLEDGLDTADEAQECIDDLRFRANPPWKDQVVVMTRAEARDALAEIGSHSFILPQHALAICAGFGVPPVYIERVRANTGEVKGLETDSGAPEDVWGVSAWHLAEHIADHFKLAYEDKMGRGSRTREAVSAVLKAERTGG